MRAQPLLALLGLLTSVVALLPTQAMRTPTAHRRSRGVASSAYPLPPPPPPQPGRLIVIRHGQSQWNLDSRFTGWANVALSPMGEQEAAEAAEILLEEDDIHVDFCYTSVLQRAVSTAGIVLDAFAARGRAPPPMRTRWRLNERHYGSLTGMSKQLALRTIEPASLTLWRRSFDGKPPDMPPDHPHYSRDARRYARLFPDVPLANGYAGADTDAPVADARDEPLSVDDLPLSESLAETRDRVGALWEAELRPLLMGGKTLLVVGHANCLRALFSCIQPELGDADLPSLSVPNAVPLVCEFDERCEPIVFEGRCYVAPIRAHFLGGQCEEFNAIDADGDGTLDAREVEKSEICSIETMYSKAPLVAGVLDEGGVLDAYKEECGAQMISEADANGDGLVNFNEYMNWAKRQKNQEQKQEQRRQQQQQQTKPPNEEGNAPTMP
jgi:2,3-bisphosphoglycerate-dependent phosphoglycerate mutase